jgi:hypothetical protein
VIAVVIGFFSVVAIGLLALHGPDRAAGAGASGFAPRLRPVDLPRLALAIAGLTGLFVVQTALVTLAARTQRPLPAWFASLPLLPIDDRAPLYGHAATWPAAALCTLFETLALLGAYRIGRGRRFGRRARAVVIAGAAVMLLAAILTPALTSFDLYAYAGSARVPDPYHPPLRPFSGDFSVLNRLYGTPIFPSPYGPVWLALARAVTAPWGSLAAQLIALRVLGALALVACALAVRALRFAPAEVMLVALNPGLIASFVLDGHNDLTAIALALWALALGSRVPAAGIVLGALAGGVKLPFLAIGALATAGAKRPGLRVGGAALTVTGGVALSALLGGRDYVEAIRTTSRLYGAALRDPLVNGAHVALALMALGAVVLAITTRRSWPTASWAFVALAASFFGWYLAWGLPYAAYERRWFPVFALSLPPLTFLTATFYAGSALLSLSLLAAVIIAPATTYLAVRRARRMRLRPGAT